MHFTDKLHGKIIVSQEVNDLLQTNTLKRLHGITMDSLPQVCVSYPLATRFEHSLGVYHLIKLALKQNNKLTSEEKTLLEMAALFHDAGNTPFSHLGETFLKPLTGRNGESFLEQRLAEDQEATSILQACGVNIEDLILCVTGRYGQFSTVLHGCVDVDNADNVLRYWFMASGGEKPYDAEFIAKSFCWNGSQWALDEKTINEVKKWQATRAYVYKKIHDNPHFSLSTMLYRALELAMWHGEIKESFFHLNDIQALKFLLTCNSGTAHLAQKVLNKEAYLERGFQIDNPHESFKKLASHEAARQAIANAICRQLAIPQKCACVYVGVGRDVKKIKLPFTSDGQHVYYPRNQDEPSPIYRLKVYIDPDYSDKASQALDIAKKMLLL